MNIADTKCPPLGLWPPHPCLLPLGKADDGVSNAGVQERNDFFARNNERWFFADSGAISTDGSDGAGTQELKHYSIAGLSQRASGTRLCGVEMCRCISSPPPPAAPPYHHHNTNPHTHTNTHTYTLVAGEHAWYRACACIWRLIHLCKLLIFKK